MNQASIIREARIGKRMTQEHLAIAACVSKRTVIRAEQGKPTTTETLRSICSVLGMDATDMPTVGSVRRSPKEILSDMISTTGETVVWSDAASSEGWRRESAVEVCENFREIVCMAFLLGLALPCLWLYAYSQIEATGRGYDIAAAGLVVTWFVFVISSFATYLRYTSNRRGKVPRQHLPCPHRQGLLLRQAGKRTRLGDEG
jgi:transcriptional regulator with XRE-family HTH domain